MDIKDLEYIDEIDTDDLCAEIANRYSFTQTDKENLLSVLDFPENKFTIATLNDQIKFDLILEAFNKYSLTELENRLK